MRVVGLALLGLALQASAHDLITAESAQAYLAKQEQLDRVIAGKEPAAERAAALVDLGRMLDEIRELFNRDIDAHGKVQGLPSNFLMSELRARGHPLAWSADRGRFQANLEYYAGALKLDAASAAGAEASFRLLQGGFYDSFTDDPLAPVAQSPSQLAGRIRLGEDYLRRHPVHAGHEEATFILAVYYMQAAVSVDGERKSGFARKARALSAAYTARYPDNLRAATLAALLERVPGS